MYYIIPGSLITPQLAATLSPKLLLIANPGISASFNQTLAGPNVEPSKSIYGSTLPPFASILFLS